MSDPYLKKAFNIGEVPRNIDLTAPPVTGFDYLYRVRLETRKCPKVVVSDLDTTQFLSRQTVQVDVCNGFISAKPGFEPDSEWQEEQLECFGANRVKISQNRESLKERFSKKALPRMNKAEEWCLFCLGQEYHTRIYPKTEVPDGTESSPKKSRLSEKTGNRPLLSIMLYLNQNSIIKLLSYHINWLDETEFSHGQGEWLYSLLTCLEKPLEPDTCALLRILSRRCSKLRDNLTSTDDEFLLPLNLILSIIAQYFDQKDMSDGFSNE